MSNHLCHFDLVVSNPSSSQSFYGAMFSAWSFGTPGPNYTLIDPGQDPKGGIRPAYGGTPRIIPMFWVGGVNGVEGAIRRIDSTARSTIPGPVVVQPMSEHPSGLGQYVVIRDPDGIYIGLMESNPPASA
jgi:predicted enzyme related to lactoylglutathione lyase